MRARAFLALALATTAACATTPDEPEPKSETDLRYVREHFTLGEVLEQWFGGAGCVFYTPEGLDALWASAERRIADPERNLKACGFVDAAGRKQGPWSEWGIWGWVRSDGVYVDGVKEGLWRHWVISADGEPDRLFGQASFGAGRAIPASELR